MKNAKTYFVSIVVILLLSTSMGFADTYLIWDPCGSPSATAMSELLPQLGYQGIVVEDILEYQGEFANYKPLIFFCDCELEETLETIDNELLGYVNNGGALYMEGVDYIWANDIISGLIFNYDIATCIEYPYTGIAGSYDSPFDGLSFAMDSTVSSSIGGGDGLAFTANDGLCLDKAIYRNTAFRGILTSYSFNSLTDSGQNARLEYLSSVIGWLTNATGIDDESETAIPENISTLAAYPNPFNPQTQVNFVLAKGEDVKLCVYNILGQPVATLYNGYAAAGEHSVIWNADNYSTGIYFARIENSSSNQECLKLVLIK